MCPRFCFRNKKLPSILNENVLGFQPTLALPLPREDPGYALGFDYDH